jgi:predicted RNase H-like HicB family nuclease
MNNRTLIDVGFEVVSYKGEEGMYVVFHPETDITGYGKTFREAVKMFQVCVMEYLKQQVTNR